MRTARTWAAIAALTLAALLSGCGTLDRCTKGLDTPPDTTVPTPHG